MIARTYELKNHLGNVLATVSDRKDYNGTNFSVDITSSQDYYPFGMQMPGRTFSSNEYKYGFNGKEKDDEWQGSGNIYNYGFRIYNPQLAKFLSVDPLSNDYPWYSTYHFAGNNPILAYDLDGLEPKPNDPNYGENAFFGNWVQAAILQKPDPDNKNWNGYSVKNLNDVLVSIKTIKSMNKHSVKNVYIQFHGNSDGVLYVVQPKDNGKSYDMTDPNLQSGENIQWGDINAFLSKGKYGKDYLKKSFPEKYNAIKDLKNVMDEMPKDGNLILGGCLSAQGENGLKLMESLNELSGKRLNIYMNADFTVNHKNYLILNEGRTKSRELEHGWVKINSDGSKQYKLGLSSGGIVLQKSGEPIKE